MSIVLKTKVTGRLSLAHPIARNIRRRILGQWSTYEKMEKGMPSENLKIFFAQAIYHEIINLAEHGIKNEAIKYALSFDREFGEEYISKVDCKIF